MKTKDNREFVGQLVATMNDIISARYFVGSSSTPATSTKCSTILRLLVLVPELLWRFAGLRVLATMNDGIRSLLCWYC
jgi:hypothetical protein